MVKDATTTKDQTPRAGSASPEKKPPTKGKEGKEGGPKLDFFNTPTASRGTGGVGVKSDIKFQVGLPFFVVGAIVGCFLMFVAMTVMVPQESCGAQTTTCQANHAQSQRSLSELNQKFSTVMSTNKVCEDTKGKLETTIKGLEAKVKTTEDPGKSCKVCEDAKGKLETTIKSLEVKVKTAEEASKSCKAPSGQDKGVKALEEKVKALTAENTEVKAYNTKISEEHKKAANLKKTAELEAHKCGEKHKAMTVELDTIRKGQATMQSDNAASGVAPAILAQSASELLTKCAGGVGPNCPPKEAIYTISWGMTNLRAALADNPAKDPSWLDYIDRVLGDCGNVLKMLDAGQNLDQNNFKILYTNSKDLFNYLSPIANKAMKPHQKTASLMGQFCKNHQCLGV